MPAELILDASAAAKLFFIDGDTDAVQRALDGGVSLLAPDLLFAEMASVAAKMVARRQATAEQGLHAVKLLPTLLDDVAPTAELVERAFAIATSLGFSAYDGCYLALAERRGAKVLTADRRMERHARQQGIGHLVQGL